MSTATTEKRPLTKSRIVEAIAEARGVTKATADAMLGQLAEIAARELGKKGPGQFTIPGMVKFTVVMKPATKQRRGANPFTGAEMLIKAKPARRAVKARVLAGLKDKV